MFRASILSKLARYYCLSLSASKCHRSKCDHIHSEAWCLCNQPSFTSPWWMHRNVSNLLSGWNPLNIIQVMMLLAIVLSLFFAFVLMARSLFRNMLLSMELLHLQPNWLLLPLSRYCSLVLLKPGFCYEFKRALNSTISKSMSPNITEAVSQDVLTEHNANFTHVDTDA